MKLLSIDTILWVLHLAGGALLTFILVRRSLVRRWRFLLAITVFDLLYGSILYVSLSNYFVYYWVFWCGLGLRYLLGLGLLWDVFRALPMLRFIPKNIGLILLAFGLTITVGSVLISLQHHNTQIYPITAQVLMIRECVTVAWACVAFTLLASASFHALGWDLEALNVTAGVVTTGIAAMVAASMMNAHPELRNIIDRTQMFVEIAVLLFWSSKLGCSGPEACSETITDVPHQPH